MPFIFPFNVSSWGRWSDILAHGRFKRPLKESDVETICRALLAYCLLHYRGDENIKSFIWDLITPSEDGTTKTLTNHSGNTCLTFSPDCLPVVTREHPENSGSEEREGKRRETKNNKWKQKQTAVAKCFHVFCMKLC